MNTNKTRRILVRVLESKEKILILHSFSVSSVSREKGYIIILCTYNVRFPGCAVSEFDKSKNANVNSGYLVTETLLIHKLNVPSIPRTF